MNSRQFLSGSTALITRVTGALFSVIGDMTGGSFFGAGGLNYGGFMNFIRESYSGEWQSNVVRPETQENILRFSAIYACVALIANDIAKLRIKLVQLQPDGTQVEVASASPSFLKIF